MSPDNSGDRNDSGFSLIEVIISMVILSLLVGIVGMNMRGLLERQKIRAERNIVTLVIDQARTSTLQSQSHLMLREYLQRPEFAEHTQTLRFSDTARINPPGACTNGTGEVFTAGKWISFTIEAMTCRVSFT